MTNHGITTTRSLQTHLRATYKGARTAAGFRAVLTARARGSVVARAAVYTREMQRAITARL